MSKEKTYIEIEGLNAIFACDDGYIYDGNERLEKFKKGWRNAVEIDGKDYYVDELIYKAFHGEIPANHFVWHTKMSDRPGALTLKSYDDYNNEKTVKKATDIFTTIYEINKDWNATLARLEDLTNQYKEATENLLTIDKNNPFIKTFVEYVEILKERNRERQEQIKADSI